MRVYVCTHIFNRPLHTHIPGLQYCTLQCLFSETQPGLSQVTATLKSSTQEEHKLGISWAEHPARDVRAARLPELV